MNARGPRRPVTSGIPPRVLVLAGGEGKRLAPLTRALYGEDLPKQFAVLAGTRSLLQETVARAATLAPPAHITVVVGLHHEALAREQLRPWPEIDVAVQPRNLDTGAGILMPLARLRARAPRARVVILPADHYFADDGPLLAALRACATGAARRRVSLVGVRPDCAESEYGWIVPGKAIAGADGRAFEVLRFVEKPPPEIAEGLRARGAVWNTFISTGPIDAYWQLARAHLPEQARLLDNYRRAIGTAREARALDVAYERMPPANFSSDLLTRSARLALVPVAGTGWSDWGSPRRVFETLAGTAEHARLLARIAAPEASLAS